MLLLLQLACRILASLYNGHVYIWNYAEQVGGWAAEECLPESTGPAACLGPSSSAARRPHRGGPSSPTPSLPPPPAHLLAHPLTAAAPRPCPRTRLATTTATYRPLLPEQSLVKSFEATDLPVRAARFVPRKQWVVCGADDMQVRVYNYNTMDKVKQFEAHSDYIRCAVLWLLGLCGVCGVRCVGLCCERLHQVRCGGAGAVQGL